jgi:peptidoglycan/LPS O-acetylase OafA/YrhL
MLTRPAPADAATGREIDEKRRIFSFEAINGWRGIGAIGIAVAHLEIISDFTGIQYTRPMIFLVDLFFVVSVLVIAQACGDRLHTRPEVLDYLGRRFGRPQSRSLGLPRP